MNRPEALLLEDDPTFLPDLAFAPLDFDLSRLDAFISGGSQTSSSLSPHTARTTPQSDQTGLILPSSGTGGVGDIGGFVVDGSDRFSALAGAHLLGEDDGFLPEADFTFDEEGNLLDLGGMRAASAAPPGATRRSTTAPAVRAPTGPRSVLEEQLRDDDVVSSQGKFFVLLLTLPISPSLWT